MRAVTLPAGGPGSTLHLGVFGGCWDEVSGERDMACKGNDKLGLGPQGSGPAGAQAVDRLVGHHQCVLRVTQLLTAPDTPCGLGKVAWWTSACAVLCSASHSPKDDSPELQELFPF